MSFLKNIMNRLSDKREIERPIVYKEFNEKPSTRQNLTELLESNRLDVNRKKIQDHLKLFSIGNTGEKSVLFELQNSMLPVLILHDVFIKYENYEAQFDFVLVTHKFILILEIKKLYGNIHITEKGEFQRVITKNNRVVNKEGMYSPITQVERHVGILENYLKSKGVITHCPIRYGATFANPKTIISMSDQAPTQIKENVVRHDQIVPFLKVKLQQTSPVFMLDEYVYQIAESLVQLKQEKPFNPDQYVMTTSEPLTEVVQNQTTTTELNGNTDELAKKLIQFRSKSKALHVKPYHIFSNKMLDDLVSLRPQTTSQLLEIEGFGTKRVNDYGKEILAIFHNELDNKINNTQTFVSINNHNEQFQSEDNLKERLIEFRASYSKNKNVKPYYVFKNSTLELLLENRPVTIEQLLQVEGFGPKKVEDFGMDIITIIKKS